MNTLLLLIAILVSETASVYMTVYMTKAYMLHVVCSGCINGKRLGDSRLNVCSSQEWKIVCEKAANGVSTRLMSHADRLATRIVVIVGFLCYNYI